MPVSVWVHGSVRSGRHLEPHECREIVAFCDVRLDKAAPAREKFSKALSHQDWREMLDMWRLGSDVSQARIGRFCGIRARPV